MCKQISFCSPKLFICYYVWRDGQQLEPTKLSLFMHNFVPLSLGFPQTSLQVFKGELNLFYGLEIPRVKPDCSSAKNHNKYLHLRLSEKRGFIFCLLKV